jgi:hypothetical protein
MDAMSPAPPRGIGQPPRPARQGNLARIICSALLVFIGVAAATAIPTYAADPTTGPISRQKTPVATSTAVAECSETPRPGDLRATITDQPAATSARFTNRSATCSYQIGLASYKKFDENIDHQELYDHAAATIAPGSTLELAVSNPPCAYQADAFWGDLITSFAGGARYGRRRLADSDGGTGYCGAGNPSATPAPTDTPVAATNTPTPVVAPTDTPVPPTATATLPVKQPTDTPVPPTDTPVPPTETALPPAVVPTDTPPPPTETPAPPAVPPVVPTDTPAPPVVISVPTDTPAPPVVVVVATRPPAPPAATVTHPPPPSNPVRPPSRHPATTRRPTNPPAVTAPVSRALPLLGTESGPETLPPTGGTSDRSLLPALLAGVLLSIIGGLMRRHAAQLR